MMVSLIGAVAAVVLSSAPLVLAVGANHAHDPSLPVLSFADDDAAAAVEQLGGSPEDAWLLTSMDEETQTRFPVLAKTSRPPTLAQVKLAVEQMRQRMESLRRSQSDPEVVVWLVGHGAFDAKGRFQLALQDAPLTAQELDQWVLTPLQTAHRIHVIVDACHAEALLTSRTAVLPADPQEVARQRFMGNLFKHPNVGFLVAAAAHQKTYEWTEMRSGVFSALVRSGLRGAANADGDDCVTYPEVTAYLAAALQGIAVPDARPRVRGEAPSMDASARLLCGSAWSSAAVARLKGPMGTWGPFHLEDERGVWLAGGRFEPGFQGELWLPARSTMTLHAHGQEYALMSVSPGELTASQEPLTSSGMARGAAERALREGLFSVPFGQSFMQGFMAARDEASKPPASPVVVEPEPSSSHTFALASLVPAAVTVAGIGWTFAAGSLTGVALVRFITTDLQRPAAESRNLAAAGSGLTAMGVVVSLIAAGLTVTLLVLDLITR